MSLSGGGYSLDATGTLLAGAAEVDITPDMGIQIAGDLGRRRPVEEIRERIYARVLVLQSGDTRFCIVSAEICWITDSWVKEIRRRASERTGIPAAAILLHPQQNHAAPGIGHNVVDDSYDAIPADLWWLRGSDDRYNEPTAAAIVEAIAFASDRVRPVTVRVGREIDGRIAFNRRFILRDGTAVMHPGGETRKQILRCEGPVDPEVGVLLLTGLDGRNVAALLHHTCHPASGYPHRFIFGDWPGNWASSMRGALGAECVPLVLNGCCGNIHHQNHLDPHPVNNPVQIGANLTESALSALRDMETRAPEQIAWQSSTLRIPFRPLPEPEIAAARELLARSPEPIWIDEAKTAVHWDWIYAHSMVDLEARFRSRPYYDYEIQALRIANTGIVAVVGEPFVEGQLRIKAESPFPYTFMAHMSNGYCGYVPTPEAIQRGGFETRASNWSKLAPEALEMIGTRALELLRELSETG